jgi:hypothetical protein
MLLSDHLAEALAALNRAREAAREERPRHLDVVQREITAAEHSIARVIGLIAGAPQ